MTAPDISGSKVCGARQMLGVDGNSYDAACSMAAGHAGRHSVEFTTGRADEFLVAEWDAASVYFSLRKAWDRTRQDRRRVTYDLHDLPKQVEELLLHHSTDCAGCIAGEGLIEGQDGSHEHYRRAGGDVVCGTCGKKYYDHPHSAHRDFSDAPYLNVLCDGRLVKL